MKNWAQGQKARVYFLDVALLLSLMSARRSKRAGTVRGGVGGGADREALRAHLKYLLRGYGGGGCLGQLLGRGEVR